MRHFFLTLFLLTGLSACNSQTPELITLDGITMGTTYSVKIVSDKKIINKNRLHTDIEKILTDVNQSMSTYIKDSELSLLNQAQNTDGHILSPDLYFVIDHAINVSQITNGAFDITIGPLVNLWGFGPEPFQRKVPGSHVIQSVKQQTGFEKLSLNKSSNMVKKSTPNLYIDLSGIAKGFAVDKIAHHLDTQNIKNYLVEIGGELIGKGKNADKKPWQIGIEQAKTLERSVQRIINLDNIAMATSGDYRNYFESDGQRYSHTIDPVTGSPINHNLASVTVLDKSAMHADAMATAFMVLGPEKSLSLANELKIAVYIIVKTDAGFEEKYNDAFTSYLSR